MKHDHEDGRTDAWLDRDGLGIACFIVAALVAFTLAGPAAMHLIARLL